VPDPASLIRPGGERTLYVNYLPMPARHRRFLRVVVPACLWVLAGITAIWALGQPDPGPAVWDDGKSVRVSGVVRAHPYPMLVTDDGVILLVEVGKRGCRDVARVDGRRCTVSGWTLTRDGRRMLELEPGDSGIALGEPSASAPSSTQPARILGPITIRGEIVDAKCYFGAMKPGEGKTHKECATLCIRGGIPPVLVTKDELGRASYYLLTDPAGERLGPGVLPLVADPVEVRGVAYDLGGFLVLRAAVADIRRL
jgi:hypothetical protein